MLFEVGETVVYPHHGAATITEVKKRIIKGEEKLYLKLNVTQGDLTIEVPAENVDLVGVRDVIGKEGLDKVFEVLRAPFTEEPTNWSRRYKANLEKLASGDVIKVSEVVRDLWRRDQDRGLSAGEKRMLAKARQILTSELALAEKTDEEKASQPTLGIIVVAAGSGTRLGESEPKAFVELRGVTILERALGGVFASAREAQVVVVAPASKLTAARSIASRAAGPAAASVSVVAGGETRQTSVAAGLAALGPAIETVLVHDAARALTPGELFDRVRRGVEASGDGIIPALAVTDTVKRVDAESTVLGTVDRSDLVHVQTPQGFPRAALDAAYATADREHTDDAALYSAAGHRVGTVEGEARAFKITTPWDLRRAENVLGVSSGIRTGIGLDVHAYDESAPLWLGGLYWPDEPGLAGHSDGDAALHAICDALLSAAGLGDLGTRFGASEERFRDARSEVFVRETMALVEGAGYSVVNVVIQLVANRPRLAGRRSELERHLSELVGAPVSVSATTADGLGLTGRGEGVVAIATALLSS
jgi:2-C-methyl-D-erythritol 4-phosphate cytidylyltransferase / 2-C-methyl-D-erythritol 2,4-cyclodiphosphate synthase